MRTALRNRRLLILLLMAMCLNLNLHAQDGIREVSRLYNLWYSAEGVAAQGDYVYVSCGVPGLQVVDVSDSGNIDVVGSLELPCLTYDVIVSGDLAFIACRDADALVRIIDISEPVNPIQIGVIDSLDSWYYEEAAELNIAIEGDYLFVKAYSDIYIFDVSNPADPRPVNSFSGDFMFDDLEISEHYIYTIPWMYPDDNNLIRVFDVSDSENPEEAGIFIYDEGIRDVAAQGNYAFATVSSGFLVIDVSEIEDMQVVTLLELEDWGGSRIFLTDNFACVSDRHNIYLIDISDPTQPDVCGIIEGQDRRRRYDVAATDDMVYVTDGNNGLKIFDVTDISEPQEIWSFQPLGHILDVELRGSHAFLAAEKGGLKVVDISNPEHPAEVGSCSFPGEASALTLDSDYAYIATGEEGLRILNISDPEDPFVAGSYDSSDVYDVALVDDFAYLTGQRFYFYILDISDPTEPSLIDTCWLTIGTHSWNVAAAGNHLYLTDGRMGDWNLEWGNLNIYDITTPDEPELVGQLETYHLLKTVVVEDNIAYIYFLEDIGCQGPESAGILIADVSDPTTPRLMSEYELEYAGDWTGYYIEDLVIVDDRLVVANSLKGLHFIDISNPENPFESEYLFTPGIAGGVAAFDHYTCVADYSNFGIYDCSGHFSVPYDESNAAEFYTLLTIYPNPFNNLTRILYTLDKPGFTTLGIFDIAGREVAVLREGYLKPGDYSTVLSSDDMPSGVYFCRLVSSGRERVVKMVLMR